ncbi:MAG: MarR family transcriptional regulator [Eubacteriales bacterium]|nr:MarR family transcriptional regulator [Eubacteriales bacterium]
MPDMEWMNSLLVDVFGRINKIEERAIAAGFGHAVSISEMHIIAQIGAEQPVRMSRVAQAVGVTLATLTVACDRLEAKGLVQRARSCQDRRVVHITLTDKGRTAYEHHRAFHERMVAAALAGLSGEQTAVLAHSLEKLRDFFRQEEVAMEQAAQG